MIRSKTRGLRRAAVIAVLASIAIWISSTGRSQEPPQGPEQPIPYSHKLHAGKLNLKCEKCHPGPDPGEKMTIPAPSVCMECHSAIKTDSPAIQKLTEFADNNRDIRWVRVYLIPSYVRFSHRAHLEAKSTCTDCHGPVRERDRLFRESDITMKGCMNCHMTRNASTDCTYCHENMN